jgi:exosortase
MKSNIPLGLKIATAVLATLAIFYQDLAIIANDALQSEYMSYILAVPFIFTYLLYRKRKMLRASIAEMQHEPNANRYLPSIAGILLTATAILLYWQGSYTFTPLEYHMIALPIFVAGLILIFFNIQTLRHSAFPVAFLFLLTPPPLEILYGWGATLSATSSQVSYSVIRLLQIPATLTSASGTPMIQITRASGATMSFAVDIACSGIYSLVAFLVFAVFTAYIIRDKLWKKSILFFIGFLLIYIINIARITTILIIGYQFGEQTALQLFHLLGGWIMIFIGTIILLLFGEKMLHAQIFSKSTEKCPRCNPKPEKNLYYCISCGRILKPAAINFRKSEIAKIVAAAAVAVLLMSIQVPVFALTNGPAELLIQTPTGEQGNTQLLPQVSSYEPRFLYRDTNFENYSGQEASLIYAYEPQDYTKEPIYVAVEIASTRGPLHDWEYCLNGPGRPVYATKLDLTDTQILDNPPILARYYAFQWVSTNETQVVLYWYETAIFMTNGTAQQKQVKISLETYPDSPQNLTRKEELLPFATAIAQHWEPIKTWTPIALSLSQQSLPLAAATSTPIPVIAVLYLLRKRNERKANSLAYTKLSQPAKDLVDIVSETEKKSASTIDKIADTYQKTTNQNISKDQLMQKLAELEKTGIIKRRITNKQDEPILIWKTQI